MRISASATVTSWKSRTHNQIVKTCFPLFSTETIQETTERISTLSSSYKELDDQRREKSNCYYKECIRMLSFTFGLTKASYRWKFCIGSWAKSKTRKKMLDSESCYLNFVWRVLNKRDEGLFWQSSGHLVFGVSHQFGLSDSHTNSSITERTLLLVFWLKGSHFAVCLCLYRNSNIWCDSFLSHSWRHDTYEPHLHSVRQLFCGNHAAVNHCLSYDWLDMEYSVGLCVCRTLW